MKLSYYLEKASDLVDRIVIGIVFLDIVAMIVFISLQIVFRVFFKALVWTEEATRYLLVWASFLGASLAYKRGMHIAVTAGIDALPKLLKKPVTLLSTLCSILFFGVCAYYGFELMAVQGLQLSPALRLPMKYVYLGIPLSFIIMTLHGLDIAVKGLFKDKEAVV